MPKVQEYRPIVGIRRGSIDENVYRELIRLAEAVESIRLELAGFINDTGLRYRQTAVQAGDTIANTTAETAFSSSVYTIPANSLQAGDVLRVRASYIHSNTGTPTMEHAFYIGASSRSTGVQTCGSGESNVVINLFGNMLVESIGSTGTGRFFGVQLHRHGTSPVFWSIGSSPSTFSIDTTIDNEVSLRWTWGTADPANTITQYFCAYELMRA